MEKEMRNEEKSERWLGKLQNVEFGKGGYQDAMIGISFSIRGANYGISDFWGTWAIERPSSAEWTEQDRAQQIASIVLKINNLLELAQVSSIDKLKNKPVEVMTANGALVSWRILTEVL